MPDLAHRAEQALLGALTTCGGDFTIRTLSFGGVRYYGPVTGSRITPRFRCT